MNNVAVAVAYFDVVVDDVVVDDVVAAVVINITIHQQKEKVKNEFKTNYFLLLYMPTIFYYYDCFDVTCSCYIPELQW
jgi:hypothetical protein